MPYYKDSETARMRRQMVDELMAMLEQSGFSRRNAIEYIALHMNTKAKQVREWVEHRRTPTREAMLSKLSGIYQDVAVTGAVYSSKRYRVLRNGPRVLVSPYYQSKAQAMEQRHGPAALTGKVIPPPSREEMKAMPKEKMKAMPKPRKHAKKKKSQAMEHTASFLCGEALYRRIGIESEALNISRGEFVRRILEERFEEAENVDHAQEAQAESADISALFDRQFRKELRQATFSGVMLGTGIGCCVALIGFLLTGVL
jgi:hypothetical protein